MDEAEYPWLTVVLQQILFNQLAIIAALADPSPATTEQLSRARNTTNVALEMIRQPAKFFPDADPRDPGAVEGVVDAFWKALHPEDGEPA